MHIQCLDKNVNIDLGLTPKRIGIMLSGGMDSALMSFLLILENKNLNFIHDIKFFNVPNIKDNAKHYSKKVFDFLNHHFKTNFEITNIGEGNLPHNKIINEPAKFILEHKLVDILASGINQNPSIDLGVRGPWRRNPLLPIPNNLLFPFIHLHKIHILEIYKHFNILDLAYITHSCTELTNGRCNQCFQCKERQWAFDYLKLENKEL